MNHQRFGNIYLVKLKRGEEVISSLTQFIKEQEIKSAWISGLGGVSNITLGYYDLETKEYCWKEFEGNLEVSSLQGNIAWMESEPLIHIHLTIADETLHSFGGHLKEAIVGGTLELKVETFEHEIQRSKDEDTGLNLLDL